MGLGGIDFEGWGEGKTGLLGVSMLAFLGGTGPEGRGLALRYALAGRPVFIGSRDASRGKDAAVELGRKWAGISVKGGGNDEAARLGNVAFICVPYEAQKSLLPGLSESLAGKVVVSVVAPLAFKKGRAVAVEVPEGSAAEESQSLLPESEVVAAFQNLSARKLLAASSPMEGDVVVCSDHASAKEKVMGLVEVVEGLRAVDGGALANARYVEQLTALLLNVNRIYRAQSSIKLVGL